jgi:hypothetical protein
MESWLGERIRKRLESRKDQFQLALYGQESLCSTTVTRKVAPRTHRLPTVCLKSQINPLALVPKLSRRPMLFRFNKRSVNLRPGGRGSSGQACVRFRGKTPWTVCGWS